MINLGKAISISIALSAAITSSTAMAAPAIVTPVVTALPSVSAGHRCVVLNTGTKELFVKAQLFNGVTGFSLGSAGSITLPGTTNLMEAAAPSEGQSFCRVTGISKNQARVTHCALNAAGTACESTVTVP